MKNKSIVYPLLSLATLILASLACGSSGIEVATPIGNQPGVESNPTSESVSLSTSTVAPLGTSRSNPAPVGSAIQADDMEFIVTGVVRPADSAVSSGNSFNDKPGSGKEYIFITLSATCKLSSDQQCTLSTYSVKVLGSDGILVDVSFISGVDGLLEGTTFYGGANIAGNIPFIVNQGDTDVLLVYQPFLGDSFYLALP